MGGRSWYELLLRTKELTFMFSSRLWACRPS